VAGEEQRTFTDLSRHGYPTDAVIVNRVFPDEVDGGYFAAWRERQQEHLQLVSEGFAPVPILTARYFEQEVIGGEMLDRLADELFADRAPADVLHTELAHDVLSEGGRTVLRLKMPFAERGDVGLKKVGAELVVTVGHEKRTFILHSALDRQRPTGTRIKSGSFELRLAD